MCPARNNNVNRLTAKNENTVPADVVSQIETASRLEIEAAV